MACVFAEDVLQLGVGVLFSTAEEKTGYQAGGVDKVVGAVAAGEEKQAEDEKLVADVKPGGAREAGRGCPTRGPPWGPGGGGHGCNPICASLW